MNQGLYKISPTKAGMDEQRLKNAFAILSREIEIKNIPGAAVMIGRGNYIVNSFVSGYKVDSYENYLVDEETIFDCASLTKVVVTIPLVLTLLEQGRIASVLT
ncbi:serine hydrolase [Virgibacillus sp. NKC19-16]|uniref:serine hydrolase n=1 Tax=Virgibacillus salidurans TaxID=2831673 RepID=UPI001F483431|nr:serine hydrolase [Virgibacillus sp. NKC19-16]UJL45400.1 serine hydrolase [Virgibacillus sp. NKC19-16]